jgi:conjugative transposon TraM protein
LLQGRVSSDSPLVKYRGSDPEQAVGFYGLNDNTAQKNKEKNMITAVVDESQTVVTGADIRMRLTSDLFVDGNLVPSGTPVTGVASLSGERMKIQISSLRYQNAIYAVSLAVYDVDGVAGIYIPGSINRDVSKESADQALSEMNMMSMDPSIGAQAATAGIQAAKTLISKKIKLVRVTIKDGYQIFLKDSGN